MLFDNDDNDGYVNNINGDNSLSFLPSFWISHSFSSVMTFPFLFYPPFSVCTNRSLFAEMFCSFILHLINGFKCHFTSNQRQRTIKWYLCILLFLYIHSKAMYGYSIKRWQLRKWVYLLFKKKVGKTWLLKTWSNIYLPQKNHS